MRLVTSLKTHGLKRSVERLRTRSDAPPRFYPQQGLEPPETRTRLEAQRDKGRLRRSHGRNQAILPHGTARILEGIGDLEANR